MTPAASYVALVHHPVLDKHGRVVTTAITNLDVHDIARATRTFGLARYFVVTPIEAQRQLVARILWHWTSGQGREHNDKRSDALARVTVVPTLADARAAIRAEAGAQPFVVATGARPRSGTWGFGELATPDGRPLLLVFGTGWGLAEEVFAAADATLAPITGSGAGSGEGAADYNHLSVRSAVAIVLDRLF